nr:hypothetical protein [Tanacetum cinerariifolium]
MEHGSSKHVGRHILEEDWEEDNHPRAPKSQDRGRRNNYRQGTKVKEQAPKALMAIDIVGWDWSFMSSLRKKGRIREQTDRLSINLKRPREPSRKSKIRQEQVGVRIQCCSPPRAQVYSPPKKDLS